MHHMRIGEFVDRDGVAIAAAFRQRNRFGRRHGERICHVLGRQHRSGAARPHRMGVAPDLEIPVGDGAVAIERRLQLRHHRRPERLPGVLLLAHPLHAHGHAGQFARDQRGVGRGIVGAVMAVTAGAFDMDAANARRRHAQHLGDALAVGIDALGVGPDRHRAIRELRNGTGRPDRAVRLIGPRIGGLDGPLAGSRRIALLEDRLVLRRQAGENARQIVLLRQARLSPAISRPPTARPSP